MKMVVKTKTSAIKRGCFSKLLRLNLNTIIFLIIFFQNPRAWIYQRGLTNELRLLFGGDEEKKMNLNRRELKDSPQGSIMIRPR